MTTFTVGELLRRAKAQGWESVRVGPGNGKSVLVKIGAGVLYTWAGTRPGFNTPFTAYDGIDASGRVLVKGITPAQGVPPFGVQFHAGLYLVNQNRDEAVTVFFI